MSPELVKQWITGNWPNARNADATAREFCFNADEDGITDEQFREAMRELRNRGTKLSAGPTWPEFYALCRGAGSGSFDQESPEVCVFGVCIRRSNHQDWYRLSLEDGYPNRGGGVYWAGDWSASKARPIEERRLEGFRFASAVALQMQGMGFDRSQVREVCPGFERFLSECLALSIDEIWPFLGVVQQAMSFDAEADPFDEDGEGKTAKMAVLSRISGFLDTELLRVAERRGAA